MTYKTLVAHLDVGKSNAEMLRVVADLAARFDARLVGIAACQPMQFAYGEGYISGETMAACQDELEGELRAAEAEFREALKGSPVSLEWRSSYTTDALPYYLASEARCADLIITSVAPADPFDSSRNTNIGDLVMRAGRPVLVVPRTGASIAFDRIVVAWKDTREARRAAMDAIPLLALAKHVMVLEIAEKDDVPTALGRVQDVAHWLELHGIKAVPLAVAAHGDDVAHLGRILKEQETDLIVAGAYGHTRLREWAFGGFTRDLLQSGRCALLSR
jgi:nucleotide-binding universal stress UspA family protein